MSIFIPTPKLYSFTDNRVKKLKRKARFAPQLLADGLSSGIVSDQGNLVHGAFDEGAEVDDYVNIHSDKFVMLQRNLDSFSVDPTVSADTDDTSLSD